AWIGGVLARSGNADIQPGGKGYCDVSSTIQAIEKPQAPVNRSMGDVHALGNPHFQLSPDAMVEASQAVIKVFLNVDSGNSAHYPARAEEFKAKLNAIKKEIQKK